MSHGEADISAAHDQGGCGSPGSPRRRWLRRLVVVALFVVVAGDIALPRWVANTIVGAPNHGKSVAELAADDPAPEGVEGLRLGVGPPAASLSLWIINPQAAATAPASPPPSVFVLHGHTDSKRSMLGIGRMLAGHGYRAILLDHRGQGRSSGDWLTYGVQESRDLSRVLDKLEATHLVQPPVYVYGASYGGATAIQWAGRDPRVGAVVAVAPFARMIDVVPVSVRHYLPGGSLLTDGWMSSVMDRAGLLAGFNPRDASPVDAILKTSARVLLIHGLLDARIPAEQSRQLAAAAPDRTRLILLEQEDHDSIMRDGTGTISRETLDWFGKAASQPADR